MATLMTKLTKLPCKGVLDVCRVVRSGHILAHILCLESIRQHSTGNTIVVPLHCAS
jgi:hypothetical protein